MKIKITSNPITQMGSFSRGDILTSDKYSKDFLKHLVYDCGAATLINETKFETKESPKINTNVDNNFGKGDKAPQKSKKKRLVKKKLT